MASATCKECGTPVGCGCHLNEAGLCGICAQKQRALLPPPRPTVSKIITPVFPINPLPLWL